MAFSFLPVWLPLLPRPVFMSVWLRSACTLPCCTRNWLCTSLTPEMESRISSASRLACWLW